MFINCPNCNALVATDLATDLPPERCPRCGFGLRETAAAPNPAPNPNPNPNPIPIPIPALASAPPPAPAPTSSPAPMPLVRPADATPDAAALRAAASTPARFVPLRVRADPASADPTPAAGAPSAPPAAPSAPLAAAAAAAAPAAPAAPTVAVVAAAPAATVGRESAGDDGRREPSPPSPPGPAPESAPPPAGAATAAEAAMSARAAGAPARATPSFLRGTRTAATAGARPQRLLLVAIPALALLLCLQLLLADRARLATDAAWRPWVGAACGLVGCRVPPWREPQAIVLVHRDVRPHPAQPGALQVTATLRNDARYAQAWPMLSLTLSDVDGRALGARWFAPEEYRPADAPPTLAPGASATVRIEVVEPSPHAVAFNFGFG